MQRWHWDIRSAVLEVIHNSIGTKLIWQSHGVLTSRSPFHILICSFHRYSFRNFERTILAAYWWLSDNYEQGDCIFLFGTLTLYDPVINSERCLGFSRDAYQVRVLSAMIDKVQYIPSAQVPKINSAEICRSASSLREMRHRYHCVLQIKFPSILP